MEFQTTTHDANQEYITKNVLTPVRQCFPLGLSLPKVFQQPRLLTDFSHYFGLTRRKEFCNNFNWLAYGYGFLPEFHDFCSNVISYHCSLFFAIIVRIETCFDGLLVLRRPYVLTLMSRLSAAPISQTQENHLL